MIGELATGFDLQGPHESKKVRARSKSTREHVQVVWHDAVGENRKLLGARNLSKIPEKPGALIFFFEVFQAFLAALSDEVSPFSDVTRCIQA